MAARRPPPEAKARARPGTARAAVLILFAVWLAFAFPLLTGMVRFPVQFDPAVAGSSPASRAARVNLEEGDAYYATFPWRAALIRRLGSGEVPLWDPSRFGGGPFAADIVQG